jgi:dephospho-CoA kinase
MGKQWENPYLLQIIQWRNKQIMSKENLSNSTPLTVGLTGGIGSGKSSVTAIFTALGVPVIDADLVAREVVAPGGPALVEITSRFGTEMLDSSGELNRQRLKELIFSDPTARQDLEQILHPRIRERMLQRLDAIDAPYTILSIPLLVESGHDYHLDRTVVVDVSEQQQLERASIRDGVSVEQIEAAMAAQCDRQERLKIADDVIDNSGSPEQLEAQVLQLHQRYMELAKNR